MKNRLLAFLLMSSIGLPAVAALKAGDSAPEFTAQASLNGKAFTYSLREALKQGPVVVYFYPSAFTSGCNVQAHAFAANKDKFTAAGASIIGVSLDSIQRLNDFSADPNFCAGKFPTASDADGKIAREFALTIKEGAPDLKDTRGIQIGHAFAERTTFIVMPNGKIAETIGGLPPDQNVQRALEAVQHIAGDVKAPGN